MWIEGGHVRGSQAKSVVRPSELLGFRIALGLVLLSAFVRASLAGDPYQPARTLAVALAAIIALGSARSGVRGWRAARLWLPAVGFLFAWSMLSASVNGFASAVWGVHGRFDGLVALLATLSAGVAGVWIGDSRARELARLAGIAAVLQAAVVVAQAVLGKTPSGTAGNQVVVGGWLAVCVALAAAGASAERGPWRSVLAAAATIGSVGLGLAGSRGAWLGVAVALAALVITRRDRSMVVLAAAVLGVTLVAAAVGGGESADKLAPSSVVQGSGAARLEIWRSTAALVADRPLLGAGPGRFLYVFPRYETVAHARIEGVDVRADQAHSRLFHVAAESGLPAAGAWVVAFGIAAAAGVAALKRRSPGALVLVSGSAAYVGQALFSVHAIEVDGLGWLIAGMLVGAARTDGTAGRCGLPWRAVRAVAIVAAGLAAAACVRYLAADVAYQRSVEDFERGDMNGALSRASEAIRLDPLTDVFRVAYADAAAYLGSQERASASAIIAAGLRLEPESYDLALARARLLELEGSAEAPEAFVAAAALYPNGVAVRREAVAAYLQAGRVSDARKLAAEILRVVPDDPEASALLKSGVP